MAFSVGEILTAANLNDLSITTIDTTGRAYFKSTDDVDLSGVSGALITGGDGTGQHIAFDTNEIQSKSDATTAATLYLNNEGGNVNFGSNIVVGGNIDGQQDFTVGNGEGELILFQGSSNYVYFQSGGTYRAYFAGNLFLPYTNAGCSLGNSSKYWAGLWSSTWVRMSGTTGIYFQTYAGGLRMQDTTWIRTYGSGKGLLSGAGMAATLSATSSLSGYNYLVRSGFTSFHYYTSSREYKDQITNFTDSGAIIDALNPVTFVEKPNSEDTDEEAAWRANDLNYGFIAEEIAENSETEHLGQYDPDFKPNGWKWPDLIAVLTAEIKSLRKRITELERQ